MKKLLNKLLFALAVLGIAGAFALPAGVAAQTKEDVCEGLNVAGGQQGRSCDPIATQPTVNDVVRGVINLLSLVVGIVAVIMMIIGGFKYIISTGDSANITSAKNTILYAIIGLVIVALAQVIVRFVLTRATAPPPTPPANNQPAP